MEKLIGIIDCGTLWLKEIEKNLTKLDKSFKVIKLANIKKCDFGKFSGIIISGAPILLTKAKTQKYVELFKFIKIVKVPVLGICFGHQIMGLVYGAKIDIGKKINKKEQIEITKREKLFWGVKDKNLFRENHCEFITLPNNFFLLAKSKSCCNEAMKHKKKKLYGIQFHPEMSGDSGEKLLKNFIEQ